MRFLSRYSCVLMVAALGAPASAQLPSPAASAEPKDSVIIFESPRPLIESTEALTQRINTWGFSVSISDYGFGAGMFYRHQLGRELSAGVTFDIGGAKGSKEFGLESEFKINRIYVMPVVANLQYRILADELSESFRPYLTAGAGPTLVMTTDAQEEFFSAFGGAKFAATVGGYFGFGANFGLDPKSNFGVSLRYYIIPYAKGVESTRGRFLTDFNGVSLTVTYGFNW